MSSLLGWALAVLAVAVGYAVYGWPGVLLALTIVVFWMLLQFSRVMRVMRGAAQRPVGVIDSAVMLHSRLNKGMRLLEILPLTRSLGHKLADNPETFVWADPGGSEVRVELQGGRLASWTLTRAPGDATTGAPPP